MSRLVVFNPGAGKARRSLTQVRAAIADSTALSGVRVEACEDWETGLRVAREATEEGCSLLIAAGGDGTVNSVVTALMGSDPPRPELAVLPLGTGNDFARSLGLPPDLGKSLALLDRSEPREIDVLRVRQGGEERYSVNVSAGGFSGRVDEDLSDDSKETWGPLAYLLKALEQVGDVESYDADFRFDGAKHSKIAACNVVIANGRYAAGGIPVAPEALLDDGLLDVVILESAPVTKLAAVAARMAAGRHLPHELVTTVKARSLRIDATPPMTFNVDGEVIGSGPLEVEVVPRAIRVHVGEGQERAFEGG